MQNLTTFDAALKDLYTTDQVVWMTYRDHPLLAMLSKDTNFVGRRLTIPIVYANAQARATSFAKAQEVASTTSSYTRATDFLLTRVKDYSLARIDGETIDASKSDAGSFLDAMRTEIDSSFDAISSSLAHALYRDGTGAKGTIASVSSATATLSNVSDIVHFEVGMAVEMFDDSEGVIQPANTFANRIISAVDRDNGTVTLPAAWATVFGVTPEEAKDKILQYGDGAIVSSELATTQKVAGLEAWCPASAPSSTAFFGVDRSVDTNRLGGIRSSGSGKDLVEAYTDAVTRLHRDGSRAGYGFVTYEDWGELEKALGSNKVEVTIPVTTEIGFRGFEILGPKGPVRIVPDQDAIPGVCHFVDMRYTKLHTLGMAPRLLDRDGNQSLRVSDDDGIEVRIGYYGNMATQAPGYNCRLTLPS